MKLLLKILHEHFLHLWRRCSVMFCFIVNLKSDHTRMLRRMFKQLTDYIFCTLPKHRMNNIHDLASSIFCSGITIKYHHFRTFLLQPGRNGIGRRPDHCIHPGFFYRCENFVNIRKIKCSFYRFQSTPCRFGNPNRIHPRLLHHNNILLQALIRHILRIICCSKYNIISF